MILVGQYDSPFVRRVAISLHHYGIPFERNRLSVFQPGMAEINPLVRIPSLVIDGDETLFDSAAILDYLDELAGPARGAHSAFGRRSPPGAAGDRPCRRRHREIGRRRL